MVLRLCIKLEKYEPVNSVFCGKQRVLNDLMRIAIAFCRRAGTFEPIIHSKKQISSQHNSYNSDFTGIFCRKQALTIKSTLQFLFWNVGNLLLQMAIYHHIFSSILAAFFNQTYLSNLSQAHFPQTLI